MRRGTDETIGTEANADQKGMVTEVVPKQVAQKPCTSGRRVVAAVCDTSEEEKLSRRGTVNKDCVLVHARRADL
jgi:hypothetical protein